MGLFGSSRKKKAAAGEYPPPGGAFLQPIASGTGMLYQLPGHVAPMPQWPSGAHAGPSAAAFPQPQSFPPANIVVNQNYFISPIPHPAAPNTTVGGKPGAAGSVGMTKMYLGSVVNLAADLLPMNVPRLFDDGLPAWHAPGSTLLNQGAALYDQLSWKFNNIMTLTDRDEYDGCGPDSHLYRPPLPSAYAHGGQASSVPAGHSMAQPVSTQDYPKGQTAGVVASLIPGNYFAKVDLYANSKLPLDLPPARLYVASYQLITLAAKYSDRAYLQPQGAERHAHIDADWRAGTKAMVIKSVPMDEANTIVFAIRGTANFMDWAVNLNMAPASPTGFLDDLGNLCHAGFLSAARKMISPVAARLRQLLEEDPGRASYSLLITGHSAGGAVAALLYAHMLATSIQASSELNLLTGCFRRIHCITFGTPPVSLLPLTKPNRRDLKNSLFLSFVNEGDPVVRADKAYVRSLIELFSSSAAKRSANGAVRNKESAGSMRTLQSEASQSSLTVHKPPRPPRTHHGHRRGHGGHHGTKRSKPVWKVPPSTLSNAGRIIVLRSGEPQATFSTQKTVDDRLAEGVVAQFTTDEELRTVIWGDPLCHVMKLYTGRIEALAIAAVMVES